MKKKILFLLFYFVLDTVPLSVSAGEHIAIIVNKMNTVESLTSQNLSRIYNGKQVRWPDGQKVVPLNYPITAPIRERFYKVVLHAEPTRKFFKPGSPTPFKTFRLRSGRAVLKFVSRVPNAIGYVYVSELDQSVKVLRIDGKLSGEKLYRIALVLDKTLLYPKN